MERTAAGLRHDWPIIRLIAKLQGSIVLDQIRKFLLSQERRLCLQGATTDSEPRLVFPGSFNPLHAGHRGMADVASGRYQRRVAFEISVTNVDKPELTDSQVLARLQHFHASDEVWLTKAPRFVEKSRLFPSTTFVLGADTLVRLIDPRYYQSEQIFRESLEEFRESGCRFLAFGRQAEGEFLASAEVPIPQVLRPVMEFVAESEFRHDVSSTEIRKQAET